MKVLYCARDCFWRRLSEKHSILSAPALSPESLLQRNATPFLFNLPGWRWATITKVALDRLSRSLHSDVCDSDGLRDAAIHSTISGRGSRRDRAASNSFQINLISPSRGTVATIPTVSLSWVYLATLWAVTCTAGCGHPWISQGDYSLHTFSAFWL